MVGVVVERRTPALSLVIGGYQSWTVFDGTGVPRMPVEAVGISVVVLMIPAAGITFAGAGASCGSELAPTNRLSCTIQPVPGELPVGNTVNRVPQLLNVLKTRCRLL